MAVKKSEYRITIGLPVYNAMPYLPKAVESILGQTYDDFRLIIISDGSTDGYVNYLTSIKDRRVCIIHQENRGLGATLNRSLDMCDTEFYARMDADDVATPDRIAAQIEYLEAHPDVVMVGSQVDFLLERKIIQGHRMPLDHDKIVHSLMLGRPVICHPSIMVRMSAVRRVGGYRIARAGQDFDFWLRLAEAGQIANMDKVLLHYRIHMNSIVATKRDSIRCGKSYAIECAKWRARRLPEPEYDDFRKRWVAQSSVWTRTRDFIESWSALQYRKSLFYLAGGRVLSGYIGLLPAMACRPGASINQIRQRVISRFQKHQQTSS